MKNNKNEYYDYKKGIDLNENPKVIIKVFHRAVRNNDMESVEKIVKQYKPSVNCKALFIAIKKNNFSMVQFLVNCGFKVYEKFVYKSIECDDIRIFKLLSLNIPFYLKRERQSAYMNRMCELGKKDIVMDNIDMLNILYSPWLFKKFDLDFILDVIKKYIIYSKGMKYNISFGCFINTIIHYTCPEEFKKLSEFTKWYYKRILRETLTPYNYKILIHKTIMPKNTDFLEKFFVFMDLVIKEEASKKIYFWWIPFCYDINRESGKRMMQNNWEKTCELLQEYNIN